MTHGHEEALRALRLADRGIVAFRALKNSPEVSLASTCLFAQQAVEKCLKAVLFECDIAFPPIHDLVRLALTLQEHDVAVASSSAQYIFVGTNSCVISLFCVATSASSSHLS